jgi:hypothetical protein
MSQVELLNELNKLDTADRLRIIEQAIHAIREELHPIIHKNDLRSNKNQLLKAAKLLAQDYKNDKELTAFTVLDSEDFYE